MTRMLNARDGLTLLGVTCASLAILWVGGGAVEAAALNRPPTLVAGSMASPEVADYGTALALAVAPVQGDLANIKRTILNTRDLLPLPWRTGYA